MLRHILLHSLFLLLMLLHVMTASGLEHMAAVSLTRLAELLAGFGTQELSVLKS